VVFLSFLAQLEELIVLPNVPRKAVVFGAILSIALNQVQSFIEHF
jgi:hypothetical protein